MKIEKFINVKIVSNIDGLISIFCDNECRGSEYYHEYFFLNNALELKAHFTSQVCLNAEQLHKDNETLFELEEYPFKKNDKSKHFIVKVNLDLSYDVLHEIEYIENGIEDGAFAICKNGLWGFIDENGVEFIKPQYKNYTSFSHGLAGVYKDGKWGFINKRNELIIPCEYEFPENSSCMCQEYDGKLYIPVGKNGKMGIIDGENNVVIPFKYDNIGLISKLIPVFLNNKLGFIDIENNLIIPFGYEPVKEDFYHTYCELSQYELIGQNGFIGLFDKENGKEVIPCEYKQLEVCKDGIIVQKQNDKYVLLNFNNEELSNEFERINVHGEGMFCAGNGEASAFMNGNGEILTPMVYRSLPNFFHGGLCVAGYKDFQKGVDVLNKNGDVLYHSKEYNDVFNLGNGCILVKNKKRNFVVKELIYERM